MGFFVGVISNKVQKKKRKTFEALVCQVEGAEEKLRYLWLPDFREVRTQLLEYCAYSLYYLADRLHHLRYLLATHP